MLSPDRDSSRRALLTVPEVGVMLGCGRTLVYSLIGSQQLPIVKIGRLTRVPVAAVEDFVKSHIENASSPPVPTEFGLPGTSSAAVPAALAGGLAPGQLFQDRSERP